MSDVNLQPTRHLPATVRVHWSSTSSPLFCIIKNQTNPLKKMKINNIIIVLTTIEKVWFSLNVCAKEHYCCPSFITVNCIIVMPIIQCCSFINYLHYIIKSSRSVLLPSWRKKMLTLFLFQHNFHDVTPYVSCYIYIPNQKDTSFIRFHT